MTDTKTKTDALALGEALELLEPYRGLRGEYRKALGDLGDRALHVVANGSPMQAVEFLGYARTSRSFIGERWRKLGLATHKRDWTDAQEGWRRHSSTPELDDIRDSYIVATSGVERALPVEWQVKRGSEFARLITVADLHYGERGMDYPRWLKMRDWIGENPDVRWLFHGDLFDLATVQSPGTSMNRQALSFDQARELAADDIAPIAGQCLAMLTGNHDLRIARALQVDFDPVRDLCRQLHIPHLGYEGWVTYAITDGKRTQHYTGYHHHGFGGGQTKGGLINKIHRLGERNPADLVVMAHVHAQLVDTAPRSVIDDEGILRVWEQQLVLPGCYLKHEGYSREQGYAPASLGSATVHFYVDRNSVHARA